MELVDLRFYSQQQLIDLIDRATALLNYENYRLTHLYINGHTAEPEYIDPDSAWNTKTPRSNVEPPIETWWGESHYTNNWLGDAK